MNEDQFNKIEDLNDKWDIAEVVKNAISTAHTTPSPVTLEILKELKTHLQEQKEELKEIKKDTKDTLVQAIKTNGRVNALEKINEETQTTISSYKKDRVRVITFGALLFFFGATIIGLAVYAIDSKIKEVNREVIFSPEFQQVLEQSVEKILSKYDIEYQLYEER